MVLFNNDGSPKYIRCWDNGGKTRDRYTIQFTRANLFGFPRMAVFIGCSAYPYHDIGYTGDRPYHEFAKSHGRRVAWEALPKDVKDYVLSTYEELWGI